MKKEYNPDEIEIRVGGMKINFKNFSWDLGDGLKLIKNRYTSFLLLFGIGKKHN